MKSGAEEIIKGVKPLELSCTACKGKILLHTHNLACVYSCPKCYAHYQHPSGKPVTTSLKKLHSYPAACITPGSYGKIFDTQYLVMGYCIKKEKHYNTCWIEYTLYNPLHGYAYLSESEGHWTFLEQINFPFVNAELNGYHLQYDGASYRVYGRYPAEVVFAEGEFAWPVLNEKSNCGDFINPPYLLSFEKTADSISFFHGEYVTPAEIKKAFDLDYVPARSGVGMNQPLAIAQNFPVLKKFAILSILITIVLQLFFTATSDSEVLLSKTYALDDSLSAKGIVTDRFKVNGFMDNLQFNFSAPLSNTWMEADVTLVNEETGENTEFTRELEYYSGYTDGESWSEGSPGDNMILNSVSSGTYYLVIFPARGATSVSDFTVTVLRDVPIYNNLLWTIILIAVFPVVMYFYINSKEKQRWENSDHSPYDTE